MAKSSDHRKEKLSDAIKNEIETVRSILSDIAAPMKSSFIDPPEPVPPEEEEGETVPKKRLDRNKKIDRSTQTGSA